MKLRKFLLEKMLPLDMMEEAAEKIKKDCDKFLYESDGGLVFRGVDKQYPNILTRKKPRLDRKPADTPEKLHDIIDSALYDKFRWRPRSEGVFVVPNPYLASTYGTVYIFFPIGDFKFIWSTTIRDMYMELRKEGLIEFAGGGKKVSKYVGTMSQKNIINDMIRSYKEYDLTSAIKSGNEIMIKCKEYYLVKIDSMHYNAFKEMLK